MSINEFEARYSSSEPRGREYYHPSGNPYASIGVLDDEGEDELKQVRRWHRRELKAAEYQQPELDLFCASPPNVSNKSDSATSAEKISPRVSARFDSGARSYILLLQNPYACLSLYPEERDASATQATGIKYSGKRGVAPKIVSREDFRKECRSIFLKYEPLSSTRTRLRPEFAGFISEHESKSPAKRASILEALIRYKLGDNLQPQLNRERLESVMQKLQAISERFPK